MDALNSDDIRQSLITRAKRYCEAAKTSMSAIGMAAVHDNKFLGKVEAGENFSIRTYQRVMDWLDKAEAELSEPSEAAE